MPDAIDLLRTRRSVPVKFLAEPGPDARELDLILTLASRVPDHGKLAPWRFIIFQGEGRRRAGRMVEDVFRSRNPMADDTALDSERLRFAAPLVIGVVSKAAEHVKIPIWEQQMSAGAVCQNMLVAALALGFGATWLTGWIAYDDDMLRRFGVAPQEKIAGFVHIGTAIGHLADRPRPDLEEICTFFV